MLPFSYTVKNLQRDPSRTLQIILGAFAVVLLVLLAVGFDKGMSRMLGATGDPDNIILVGAGALESLERSTIPAETTPLVAASPGIVKVGTQPAVSTEVHYMAPVTLENGSDARAYFRGVGSESILVHDVVRLTEGHLPRPGEIIVGALAYRSLGVPPDQLSTGKTLQVGTARFRIAGQFAAPDTRFESELWGDRSDLLALTKRENPSCVIARTEGDGATQLSVLAMRRSDLELATESEADYYAGLAKFFGPIVTITWVSALLVALGAIFGGFNTLYAAFGSRTRELAALQAMGFSRTSIFLSLLTEALLACLLGTLLACVLVVFVLSGTTIPLSAGTLTLRFGASALFIAIGTGLGLGVLGAALPAWNCLRIDLPKALRSI